MKINIMDRMKKAKEGFGTHMLLELLDNIYFISRNNTFDKTTS